MIPLTQKDVDYWRKRKKNNDSAKRSREAKKEKEKNFYRRALELEYENYFLKERLGQVEAQLHAATGLTPTPQEYSAPTSHEYGAPTASHEYGVHNASHEYGAHAASHEYGADTPHDLVLPTLVSL